MILGYYDGLHYLDLLSSFQNTAWSALYGSYPQDDPLFSCLSNFRSQCYSKGIQLEYASTWIEGGAKWRNSWVQAEEKQIPRLFVIAGQSKKIKFEEIVERVASGSNLAILYSQQLSPVYKDSYEDIYKILDINEKSLKEYATLEKVATYGKGKIFYIDSDNKISDGKIERGPFGGRSDIEVAMNREVLGKLIGKISLFSVPHIDCYVRSIPATWSQDENLIVEIEVENKSDKDMAAVFIEVLFSPEFEPISNTAIQLSSVKAKSKRSITTLAIPRVKGEYDSPVQILITYNKVSYSVFLPSIQIQILDNLQNLLRASKPLQINIADSFLKYGHHFMPVAAPDVMIQLLDIDPDSVVSKARRVGENISKTIAQKNLSNFNTSWNFASITQELHAQNIISSKAKGYIDTVRMFGNMASHANGTKTILFAHEDALIVLHALFLFLKEITEANLL